MYIQDNFNKPFMEIKWKYSNTHDGEKFIKTLKMKHSSGYDEITNRIIKSSLPFAISSLTRICNAVLHHRKFPAKLKYATVRP
jgi:hypothetical protein